MLKFRCQHCGQRIAVPARHLGKLVTCAECGKPTHPLAEQIVKTGRTMQPAAPTTVASVAPEASSACANCARPVGKLQASHLWEGQRVCGACYHVLSAESSLGAARPSTVVAARVRPPAHAEVEPIRMRPAAVGLREQLVRGVVVFIVAVVALYGALTLLRDLAGLIAVTSVAVLALLALYAVFRSRWAGRFRSAPSPADAALVTVRGR